MISPLLELDEIVVSLEDGVSSTLLDEESFVELLLWVCSASLEFLLSEILDDEFMESSLDAPVEESSQAVNAQIAQKIAESKNLKKVNGHVFLILIKGNL